MKRFSLILASLALVFCSKASAFVGGPFDNGDYTSLLDNSGIYQMAFRFSNGSGFAQFGTNVNPSLFLATATAGQAPSTTYSVLNRSLIYYKGVTYLGSCAGMVDHELRLVTGVTNGNSDVSTSQTTSTGGTTFTSGNTLIFNGLGFPCNTNFNCKITKTYPVLRYSGEGELSIVNPSLAQVAYSALSALISSQQGATGAVSFGSQITSLVEGIAVAAAASDSLIPSAEQTHKNSDILKMRVFGSRVFFVSTR